MSYQFRISKLLGFKSKSKRTFFQGIEVEQIEIKHKIVSLIIYIAILWFEICGNSHTAFKSV